MLLETVVSLSMVVTTIRLAHHLGLTERTFPVVFLAVCLFGQLAALAGMAFAVPHLIKVGHVIFTLAMWVGAIFLNVHSLETHMANVKITCPTSSPLRVARRPLTSPCTTYCTRFL